MDRQRSDAAGSSPRDGTCLEKHRVWPSSRLMSLRCSVTATKESYATPLVNGNPVQVY
jgi:hypothetical protein